MDNDLRQHDSGVRHLPQSSERAPAPPGATRLLPRPASGPGTRERTRGPEPVRPIVIDRTGSGASPIERFVKLLPYGEASQEGTAQARFSPTHPYVERCWLPVIGPSATWCLRRLARELKRQPDSAVVDLAELARDLGLSPSLSRNAPMAATLSRLCHFELVRFGPDASLEVRTMLPPTRGVSRLGPGAALAHQQMVAEAVNPLLAAALSYARRGWAVLPLRAGDKVPDGRLVPRGLLEATTSEEKIHTWWRVSWRANVGIRTGEGLDVVDIDSAGARAELFDPAPGDPGAGVVVKTGRGWHLWFASQGLASRVAVLPGVDVRGRGGYVVAPPSVHPGGWRYQFLDEATGALSTTLLGQSLPAVPGWLVERLSPHHQSPSRPTEPVRLTSSHYVRAAVESECAAVASTPEGGRNHRLNTAAFSLGTLIGARLLTQDDARDRLVDAARSAGLDEREALCTIASGLRAGEKQPRAIASLVDPEKTSGTKRFNDLDRAAWGATSRRVATHEDKLRELVGAEAAEQHGLDTDPLRKSMAEHESMVIPLSFEVPSSIAPPSVDIAP